MSKVILATFLILFYLGIVFITPYIGRSIVMKSSIKDFEGINAQKSSDLANDLSMLSIMTGIFRPGFSDDLKPIATLLWFFNLASLVCVIAIIRGG